MKCLFMLRLRDHAVVMAGSGREQRPMFFESKTSAKAARDELRKNSPGIGEVYITYGPDHRLYASNRIDAEQRRRKSLPKRARRTKANMGRPQPQKAAARRGRTAPLAAKADA